MRVYLIIAILSILFWQLIVTVFYVISKENDKVAVYTGIGFWLLPLYIISFIYKKTMLYKSRRYNCYRFFGQIKENQIIENNWIGNYYMTPKLANKFRYVYTRNEKVKESYSIQLLREGKDFKSAPHNEEIITKDKIKNGFAGMTYDYFKKFLK